MKRIFFASAAVAALAISGGAYAGPKGGGVAGVKAGGAGTDAGATVKAKAKGRLDADGDGIRDTRDIDDDNDGVLDINE